LGDLEERLIPSDHQPAGVDVGSVQVAEEELQHLGDAAPLLGGVEVPKAPACELIGGVLQTAHELSTLIGVKDGFEPPRVELRYRNILDQRACRLLRQWATELRGMLVPSRPTTRSSKRETTTSLRGIARLLMARPPSSSSVAAYGAWLLAAELTDLLEHPTVVHAGDLIGVGVSAQPDSG
jgi:hypothetical protein